MSLHVGRRGARAIVVTLATIVAIGSAPAAMAGSIDPPRTSSSGITAIPAWPVLRIGSTGADVRTAQHLLTAWGHTTTADGAYGSGTAAAVKAFQSRKGLTADGIIGAQTWSALAVTISEGARGSAVKALQVQLNNLGASLAVDGIFGGMTASTVRFWQWHMGLTADGIVGPQTWRAFIGS
ncbi:peptidoglycan-binding domain-containing protein [Stackebrandtia soli]|uniref:peptidoglycan-binding domain-containing protein n=1 Tax=Stackebrandtia soli TaxID=1892856 RepID=UPI0039E735B6